MIKEPWELEGAKKGPGVISLAVPCCEHNIIWLSNSKCGDWWIRIGNAVRCGYRLLYKPVCHVSYG
jgi:hypothetical protein